MIEIKISIEAAANILTDRMRQEFRMRQRTKILPAYLEFKNLSYDELIAITETSVFDTVFMLPVDLFFSENNLIQLVTKTIQSLAKVYNRQEFLLYDEKKTKQLLLPIQKFFMFEDSPNTFICN